MQGSELPEFHQPELPQIPLGDGIRYKSRQRLPGQFSACLLQVLLSNLTADWFLGRAYPWGVACNRTSLSLWSRDMRARLSDRLNKGLDTELQYIFDFVLFDHVKVKIVQSGPTQAIEDLCVRGGAVMAESACTT